MVGGEAVGLAAAGGPAGSAAGLALGAAGGAAFGGPEAGGGLAVPASVRFQAQQLQRVFV